MIVLYVYITCTGQCKFVRYRFRGGLTYTGTALEYVRETILTSYNGDRSWTENVVIVMTDGASSDRADTILEASNLHNAADKVCEVEYERVNVHRITQYLQNNLIII